MGLRLVLAGLVVGLGFELPARQELERWLHSGHTWVCVRLDEWNAWTALDEEPIVLGAEITRPAPPAPARESLSEEELAGLVADMAAAYGEEGLVIEAEQPAPAATAEKPATPVADVAVVTTEPAAQPAVEAAQVAVTVEAQANPAPSAPEASATPAPAPKSAEAPVVASDEEFAAVVENVVTCFASDDEALATALAVARTTEPAAPAAGSVAPLAPEAALELNRWLEEEGSTAAAVAQNVNEAVEEPADEADIEEALAAARAFAEKPEVTAAPAVADPAPAVIAAAADEPTPAPAPDAPVVTARIAFEPIEVPEDLYPGLAFELNRFGDGLSDPPIVPAPEPAAGPQPEPEPVAAEATATPAPATVATTPAVQAAADSGNSRGQRLATAVRLTSEALDAWAKLIQGPAVVSIRP